MRESKQSFLKIFTLRNFCIAILLATFLTLAGFHSVSSVDVSANFTVTDAKLFRGGKELTTEYGIPNNVYFHAHIEWSYESEKPISLGDTVSFRFGSQNYDLNGTQYHVHNSNELPIKDENGSLLGYWSIVDEKIKIRFSDSAVGHYTLQGSIDTAQDILMSGAILSDKIVTFPIANKVISFLKTANGLSKLNDSHGEGYLATNDAIYWSYWTPGITTNEFYRGNGQAQLSEKATFSNLSYETTLSPLATKAIVNIYALAQVPLNITDGNAGASNEAAWINVTKLFNRKNQTEGQKYEDFYESLNDGEYGIYRESNGIFKVAVKFGSQPSDITYSQALAASGKSTIRVGDLYSSMPEARDAMNLLDSANTVTSGKILRFMAEAMEILPKNNMNSQISNDATVSYDINDGEEVNENNSKTITIPLGAATANIIGEARLRLVDENTGKPLPDRNFILQVQDGDEWKDVPGTERTTDANGRIQILGLTPGKDYRWQQLDFADHYNTDSLKVRLDQPTRRGVPVDNPDFIMPTNAGISFTATNALQTYTVTYQLGDGSTNDDIVYTQSYGETTKQPDMTTVNVVDGYTFEGWSSDIADIVTEDATYTARWSAVLGARRTTPTGDPIPESVNTVENPELPSTYDGITRYVVIMACSLVLSLYFAPGTIRAYRVN